MAWSGQRSTLGLRGGGPAPAPEEIRDPAMLSQKEEIKDPVSRSKEIAQEKMRDEREDGPEARLPACASPQAS